MGWTQRLTHKTVKVMGSGWRMLKWVFPLLKQEDKVYVYYVATVSFKVEWSSHKQRFLVSQCLLLCSINTITQKTRVFGLKILCERILHFKCENGGEFFSPFSCKIMGMLDFWVQVPYLGTNAYQQREINMIYSFISFLHARHLLTMDIR